MHACLPDERTDRLPIRRVLKQLRRMPQLRMQPAAVHCPTRRGACPTGGAACPTSTAAHVPAAAISCMHRPAALLIGLAACASHRQRMPDPLPPPTVHA
jgi:hypothetical protein